MWLGFTLDLSSLGKLKSLGSWMGIHGPAQNSQPAPADDLFSGGRIMLRDNQLVDYYEDPYSPGPYRYETNRYPYVEVEHDGELFHARAQGWKGNMLMIARMKKPTRQGRQRRKRNILGARHSMHPHPERRFHMGYN